jgi:hypothetical protein
MPNKIKPTDLTALNRSWVKTLLDNLLIGKIFDIKVGGSPMFTFIKDYYHYNTQAQGVQYLTESEIRFIDSYTYSRGKLFTVYQVVIPNLSHERANVVEHFNEELTKFLQTTENFKELDLFWYDRSERLSDYTYYFQQLDKIRDSVKYFTPEGKNHSNKLRIELESDIKIMIEETEARTRECFLIVSTPLLTLEEVKPAKKILEQRIEKLTKSLKLINLGHREIGTLDIDWLFSNFVSHKIMR